MNTPTADLRKPYFLPESHQVYGIHINNQIIAGMPFPPEKSTLWQMLYEKNIQNVVCLTDEVPIYNPAPLKILSSVELEDLLGRSGPSVPNAEKHKIENVVGKIVGMLTSCESVVIHCAGGTGRTGTVIGCVLRALGYDSNRVLQVMQDINVLRGREGSGWPESEWQKKIVEGWE